MLYTRLFNNSRCGLRVFGDALALLNAQPAAPLSFTMPVLEGADSVQLDPKIAGLLLYALQTASLNLRHMKLEPFNHETVVIDPRSVADNGVGDDEDSSEEEHEEDEPARPSTKPAHVGTRARAPALQRPLSPASRRPLSPGFRRQPGADKNAIVAELDEDAIARQLLEFIAFAPPTPK